MSHQFYTKFLFLILQVPVTRSQSPKPGNNKATPSKVESRISQTPNRPTVKSNVSKHFQGKNPRSAAYSLISRPKRTTTITHENTSPNIQYGQENTTSFEQHQSCYVHTARIIPNEFCRDSRFIRHLFFNAFELKLLYVTSMH